MSNFIGDDLDPPSVKSNRPGKDRPGSVPATQWWGAEDYNPIRQYLIDVRDWVKGNVLNYFKLKANPSLPSPASGLVQLGADSSGRAQISQNGASYESLSHAALGIYNVKDYGAKGDGTTDDTAAIQAVIDIVKALPNGGTVFIPDGVFKFSNLNMTKIGTSFDKLVTLKGVGRASKLKHAASPGGIAIDISGSNSLVFEDFYLETGSGTSIGILATRYVDAVNCNGHRFNRVRIQGGATMALLVNLTAEDFYVNDCDIFHEGTPGDSAVFVGCNNNLGIVSAYGTIQTAIQSTIDIKFKDCRITSAFTTTGVCVHLDEAAAVSFDHCFTGNSSAGTFKAHVYFTTPTVHNFAYPCVFDDHIFEGDGDVFLFEYPGADNLPYSGLKCTNSWKSRATGKWINATTVNNTVGLEHIVFQNNFGVGDMAIGITEKSIIEHFSDDTSLLNIAGFAGGCLIRWNKPGNATIVANHGSKVEFYDYPNFPSPGGGNIDRYGSTHVNDTPRVQQWVGLITEPLTAQKVTGALVMADGVNWNPLNSANGTPYPTYYDGSAWRDLKIDDKHVANVRKYGAKGDGATDDSAAIQAAINAIVALGAGTVYFPVGTYNVNSTLTITGPASGGVNFVGEQESDNGVRIAWGGVAGGTIFHAKALTYSQFRNLKFDGENSALYAALFEYNSSGGAGSYYLNFERCSFIRANGAGSAGIALGDAGGHQLDTIDFVSCYFGGGNSESGMRMLGTGNVKNVRIWGGAFIGGTYGLYSLGASNTGALLLDGVTFTDLAGPALHTSAGQHTIKNCAFESANANCRLVYGTTGQNPGSLSVINSYFYGPCPSDDAVIYYPGTISLLGNHFQNARVPGTSVPKIVCNAVANSTASGAGAVDSRGNFYENASGRAPIYDDSANALLDDFGRFYPASINSFGDTGGLAGGGFVRLANVSGTAKQFMALQLASPDAGTGITVLRDGEVRRAVKAIKLDHSAFPAAALTKDILLGRPGPTARIVGVITDTTAGFTGGGHNYTLEIGTSAGGSDLILSHNVNSPVTKGLADGDLGTALARATAVQGGVIPTWGTYGYVYARLTADGANLNDLATGSVTVYIITEDLG